jgi:ABC-type uncharacterized transport system substrate-binding protein
MPRVGVITLSVAPTTPTFEAFRVGLRERGYTEGQNIALEIRFAEGKPERLAGMVAELVQSRVHVIVTESVLAATAVRQATDRIPIVTAVHGDPVGAGLAASLARPGGNVTGLSLMAVELSEKRLELLKGGLIAYGPSLADNFRRSVGDVDRILKGARPADLPIEQPQQFELIINLKAMRAISISVPQSVMQRANEVIE